MTADIGRIPWCWSSTVAHSWPRLTLAVGWELSQGCSPQGPQVSSMWPLYIGWFLTADVLDFRKKCFKYIKVETAGQLRSNLRNYSITSVLFYQSMQIMGLVKIQGEKKNGKEFEATFNLPQLPFPIT